MKRLLRVAAVLAAGACAHVKADRTVCPEYRSLRCMTDVVCSMDRERGCKVCECRDPEGSTWQNPDTPSDPPR